MKNNFNELKQTKKGDVGENIINQMLKEKGYTVYSPSHTEGHLFDNFAIHNQTFKQLFFETKTYARMNKFEANGIDASDWKKYNELLGVGIDILLFFIDEHPLQQSIYCAKISELQEQKKVNNINYPNQLIAKNKVLFSLDSFRYVRNITEKELVEIKLYNQRNYDYN